MEKVHPWCGQPSDRGRLRGVHWRHLANTTELPCAAAMRPYVKLLWTLVNLKCHSTTVIAHADGVQGIWGRGDHRKTTSPFKTVCNTETDTAVGYRYLLTFIRLKSLT